MSNRHSYRKYDHVERLGHRNVDGLTIGDVYVFPKLDGTNSVVWLDIGGYVRCGSRNRPLIRPSGEFMDNQGFGAWANDTCNTHNLLRSLLELDGCILYGEWLVPHTVNGYREHAWKKFYVFDVYHYESKRYLKYDSYSKVLFENDLDYMEPQAIITNPSDEQINHEATINTYLMADGAGVGEGVVVKNYDWVNFDGKQPWAKVVRNEFKEDNRRAFGVTEKHGEFQVEAAIAEEFVTSEMVNKTLSKIVISIANEERLDVSDPNVMTHIREDNRSTIIPRLLQTVYNELVSECSWEFVKAHKDPVVSFKKLRQQSIAMTKKYANSLF